MRAMFAIVLTLISSEGTVFGFSPTLLICLGIGTCMAVSACWQISDNFVRRVRGRNWPTVSAVIDLVSVGSMTDNALHFKAYSSISYYLATLTYTYGSPEQQMGHYSRRFGDKDEAEAWANCYKGETITVHVDPRDPTRSVLREEDL